MWIKIIREVRKEREGKVKNVRGGEEKRKGELKRWNGQGKGESEEVEEDAKKKSSTEGDRNK